MHIFNGYFNSPVGLLKINATNDAVTRIIFCEERSIEENSNENELISTCIQQLEKYFTGGSADFTFPISQQGTPFQQSVWKELMKIEAGKGFEGRHDGLFFQFRSNFKKYFSCAPLNSAQNNPYNPTCKKAISTPPFCVLPASY